MIRQYTAISTLDVPTQGQVHGTRSDQSHSDNVCPSRGRGKQTGSQTSNGFTLLEVVLALGLSMLLMGSVLTAIEIYRRVTTAGREDVEKSQVARALFRMMEVDIRSCTFQRAESGSSGGGATGGSDASSGGTGASGTGTDADAQTGSDTDTQAASTLDTATAFAGDSEGIVGDAVSIVIHASRPADRLTLLAAAATGETTSDAKSIAYFLSVPGGAGLQGITGEMLATGQDRSVQGLSRLEGDRLLIQFAEANGEMASLAGSTKLLAAEVDNLRFRYYDGLAWYDAWDSASYQRLPLAVEITLSLKPWSAVGQTSSRDPPPSRSYRYVVAIPTAEPAVLAAATELTAQ